jgi:hypothetical protein
LTRMVEKTGKAMSRNLREIAKEVGVVSQMSLFALICTHFRITNKNK